ncbi:MAG: deoxyribose-phosphate aldolase [Bacteroidales bacterium]
MNFLCRTMEASSIKQKISEYQAIDLPFTTVSALDHFILNCIDHTSLSGTDNDETIEQLCRQAEDIRARTVDGSTVASVCVYPNFASIARSSLQTADIEIASVAGAFPSGQSPLSIRVAEARQAVKDGATEIDMVISRGRMLAGDYDFVLQEVKEIKKTIGSHRLKVILETGELQDFTLISKASEIAIQGGADFIKTSTGKMKPAATLESFLVMLDVIKTYYHQKGIKVGIKPAGGISDPELARNYVRVLFGHLGSQWLTKKLFRIGASSLTSRMLEVL